MPAYTPKYQIPYPVASDPVNASVFQAMAERMEQTLTNAQMPKAEQNLQVVGPFVPAAFTERQNVTTTKLELCNVTIPDPGWRYRIIPFGRWQTWSSAGGTRPDIEVRVGTVTGQAVGFGLGSNAAAANQRGWVAIRLPISCWYRSRATTPSHSASMTSMTTKVNSQALKECVEDCMRSILLPLRAACTRLHKRAAEELVLPSAHPQKGSAIKQKTLISMQS